VAQPLGLNFRVAVPSRFFEGGEGWGGRSHFGQISCWDGGPSSGA
jgi:hypothetical protein